jgi:DnaJ-class molecular chaperone
VTIETVSGKLNIEVPAGTQSGDKLILKQQGSFEFRPPDLYDESQFRGDHVITFRIVLSQQFNEV